MGEPARAQCPVRFKCVPGMARYFIGESPMARCSQSRKPGEGPGRRREAGSAAGEPARGGVGEHRGFSPVGRGRGGEHGCGCPYLLWITFVGSGKAVNRDKGLHRAAGLRGKRAMSVPAMGRDSPVTRRPQTARFIRVRNSPTVSVVGLPRLGAHESTQRGLATQKLSKNSSLIFQKKFLRSRLESGLIGLKSDESQSHRHTNQ